MNTKPLKKRGPKPKGEIPVWSADLAYVVGVIASDGCLSNDRRHIDVTSKDRGMLKTVLKILKKKNKIAQKKNGNGGHVWRVQFGDVYFYTWLVSIGLTPNKSLTLGPLAVPDEFFPDFVRGLWDGDGTVHSYFDPRWGTFMYYIAFATGSRTFAQWLLQHIEVTSGASGHIATSRESSGKSFYQIRYAKAGSQEIFAWMFYAKNVPHLPRKFAKMKKILTIAGRQVDKRFTKNCKKT